MYLDTDDEYRFHVTIDVAFDGQEVFLRFFWRNSKPEVSVTMEDGTTLANYFNDYIGRTTNYSEADPMVKHFVDRLAHATRSILRN